MAADWGVPKGFSSGKQARKHAAVRNCRIVDRISPLDDTYSRDRWSGVPSHPIGRVPQPGVTAERRVRARGLQGGLLFHGDDWPVSTGNVQPISFIHIPVYSNGGVPGTQLGPPTSP